MSHVIAPERDVSRKALVHAQRRRAPEPELPGRMLDVTIALIVLIVLAPVMCAVACAVALERKGPILFAHSRIGRGERAFNVLKFRSMRVDGDRVLADHLNSDPEAAAEWARDHKLREDPRVTKLGQFLRRSSLDELPQLINVIRGDMSLVGPRPIVQSEVYRYGRFFKAYCSVRPGITGVWQVSGRNDVTYRRRVAMDALYARRKGVLLDMRLLLATIPAVFARRGSY